ncbi:MAG: PEP-CTERM sorting domain-containing protein [Terriglobia bacterium]
MIKNLKLLSLAAAIVVMMAMASVSLRADTLQAAGLMNLNPTAQSNCTTASGGCQAVTFGTINILATQPGETITSSSVTLPDFDLGWTGSAASFNPSSGPLGVTINGQTLTGNIGWEELTGSNTGGFTLTVGLTGLAGGGTDPVLDAFAANGNGNGNLTFQFAPDGITSISGLVANTSAEDNISVSGTLATPEPASLSLVGIGLLGFAFAFRKRIKAVA